MNVETVKIDSITFDPANVRKHDEKNLSAIKASLNRFGQQKPIVVDANGVVRAGNGTLAAAKALGWKEIRIVRSSLAGSEATAYAIADNRTAELAEWDNDALAQTLAALQIEDDALAESTGFDLSEIERLTAPNDVEEDEVPEAPVDPITKTGYLWILGEHRLLCGDSTKAEDVYRLMDRKRAELCHADPPYGMGKEADGVANDNLYGSNLDAFQMEWWRAFRPHMVENASAYVWGNAADLWRWWYVGGLRDSERMTLRNEIVWDKGFAQQFDKMENGNPTLRSYNVTTERCLFLMLGEQGFNNNADNYWDGWDPIRSYLEGEMKRCGWTPRDLNRITGTQMGSHWVTRSQWSLITADHYASIQKATEQHDAFKQNYDELKQNYDELKQNYDELKRAFYETRSYFDNTHDNMTDVWSFDRVKGEERHGHATPKPVQIIARAIMSSSRLGAVVVDPFLGSGTTLIAAEKLGRKCYGMEISPAYCDVIVKRWENLTGKKAVRE
jgi:DNA modification methylase